MTYFLLTLLFLTTLALQECKAYAYDELCAGWGSWVRGSDYFQMNVDYFSNDSKACIASISPNVDTYLPGQTFTLFVTPYVPLGIKAVILGGAEIRTTSQGGALRSSGTCANFDLRTGAASMTFRTPTTGGDLTIKALCGSLEQMHVATDIVIKPGIGVLPLQLETSTDKSKRYTYQKTLQSNYPKVIMHYTKNETHLDVKIEYSSQGYIALGVGRMMLKSMVLIGVNPEANSRMPPVGLYRLTRKERGGAYAIVPGSLFENAGIVDASYTEISYGRSELLFTQLLSAKPAEFMLTSEDYDTPITNIIWAVGPYKYGKHSSCGTVLDVDFYSNFTRAPTSRPTLKLTMEPTLMSTNTPTTSDEREEYDNDYEEYGTNQDDDSKQDGEDQSLGGGAVFAIVVLVLLVFGCGVVVVRRRLAARIPDYRVANQRGHGIDYMATEMDSQTASRSGGGDGGNTSHSNPHNVVESDSLAASLLLRNTGAPTTATDDAPILI